MNHCRDCGTPIPSWIALCDNCWHRALLDMAYALFRVAYGYYGA